MSITARIHQLTVRLDKLKRGQEPYLFSEKPEKRLQYYRIVSRLKEEIEELRSKTWEIRNSWIKSVRGQA